MINHLIIHPDSHLMRFSALPVLAGSNVRGAPILENHISSFVRLNS